jgi:ADP-heptose:LPS heptosyltransferase
VHLASGIGNVVLATPLLLALDELGFEIDVCLDADYAQTADLLCPWSIVQRVWACGFASAVGARRYDAVIPAVPPFYWARYRGHYHGLREMVVARPPDAVFHANEQAYYLSFACALGYPAERRVTCRLPIGAREDEDRVDLGTVVIAPGCKTGTMAAKRWPYFPALAERFGDVALVGTGDDLRQHDGGPMNFPAHVRTFVDRLTLRETAELIAAAGVVVANDSGLAHVSAAVGTATVVLFGPTDHDCLGPLPPPAMVLRTGLPCEPCWAAAPLEACARRIDCLRALSIDRVEHAVRSVLGRPCTTAGATT